MNDWFIPVVVNLRHGTWRVLKNRAHFLVRPLSLKLPSPTIGLAVRVRESEELLRFMQSRRLILISYS